MKPVVILEQIQNSDVNSFIDQFDNKQEGIKDYILSNVELPEGYEVRWHDDGFDDFLLIIYYNIEDYQLETAKEAEKILKDFVNKDKNLNEIFDRVTLDEEKHIVVDVTINYHPGYYEVELWVKEKYYEILGGKYEGGE